MTTVTMWTNCTCCQTRNGINGATKPYLYDGMLEECANMVGDDIYILPSSVQYFAVYQGKSKWITQRIITRIS